MCNNNSQAHEETLVDVFLLNLYDINERGKQSYRLWKSWFLKDVAKRDDDEKLTKPDSVCSKV